MDRFIKVVNNKLKKTFSFVSHTYGLNTTVTENL